MFEGAVGTCFRFGYMDDRIANENCNNAREEGHLVEVCLGQRAYNNKTASALGWATRGKKVKKTKRKRDCNTKKGRGLFSGGTSRIFLLRGTVSLFQRLVPKHSREKK